MIGSVSFIDPAFFSVPLDEAKMNLIASMEHRWDSQFTRDIFRSTKHSDAIWIINLFNEFNLNHETECLNCIKRIIAQPDTTGRNLFFAYLLSRNIFRGKRDDLLQISMEMGYKYAFGERVFDTYHLDDLKDVIQCGIRSGDPVSMFTFLIQRYDKGESNVETERLQESIARMGHMLAMSGYSKRLDFNNPLRWTLSIIRITQYGSLEMEGDHDHEINALQWNRDTYYVTDLSTLFLIGELATIFEKVMWIHEEPRQIQLRNYYRFVCNQTRQECIIWVLISKHIRLHKDIRIMISKLIWESRKQGREGFKFYPVKYGKF